MRGLSYDEKRRRLEDLFYETKDFFQLKELEKIAPKTKGIVAQSVKEVLQSLVDDEIVKGEKIGTSNYFWSFPSAALKSRQRKIDDLETSLNQLIQKNEELQASIAAATDGREDTDERAELLQQLSEIESKHTANKQELDKFRECDPVLLKAKERAANEAKDAANRWTDNIFIIQSYCVNKFGVETADFNKQFGITDDFDNLP
ncbi:Meiotic nuclear division protein 1 [Dimargaris verticillata]|uniref:Meiotic nuclear division protein 1 n=1 Tax=Dimargaris verticillata TaxID=2761393 RepID=A0A9W8BCY4_9FUNG|nr:Meiotic nuclear division protein 1 [Dimargaris verticillata]